MLRLLSASILLLTCIATAASAPCSGRLYYQTQGSYDIHWSDVSTSNSGFSRSGSSSQALLSSSACAGTISAYNNVLCCATSSDIRCWNTTAETPVPYDLGVSLPSSVSAPYDVRVSLEANTVLLAAASGSHVLRFQHFWADGTGSWQRLSSTQDHGWNILNLASGPFFHVLPGIETQVTRIPASTLQQQANIPTVSVVQSVAHIGNESFGLHGSPTSSIIRWVEDGINTAHTVNTLSGSVYVANQTKLTDAYSVGSCPYFIIYSTNGSVSFAESLTATAHKIDGSLASSVTSLAFAKTSSDDDAPSPSPKSDDDSPAMNRHGRPSGWPWWYPYYSTPRAETSNPTSAAVPTPDAAPNALCRGRRPTNLFDCINGTWTANVSIVADTIVVSSRVAIFSTFNVSRLVLEGLESSVTVHGCAALNGSITMALTEDELKTINGSARTVLSVNGCASGSNFSQVNLIVEAPTKSCDQFDYGLRQEQTGTQTNLVALFQLDMGGCKNNKNLTIILAICIPVGVILIAVAVIVVLSLCSSTFRTHFRPFAKKNTY